MKTRNLTLDPHPPRTHVSHTSTTTPPIFKEDKDVAITLLKNHSSERGKKDAVLPMRNRYT